MKRASDACYHFGIAADTAPSGLRGTRKLDSATCTKTGQGPGMWRSRQLTPQALRRTSERYPTRASFSRRGHRRSRLIGLNLFRRADEKLVRNRQDEGLLDSIVRQRDHTTSAFQKLKRLPVP